MKRIQNITIALILWLNAAIIYSQAYTWMPLGSGPDNGLNNYTYSITLYNGKLIYGGSFTVAGGVNANFVAAFDPVTNSWSPMGNNINGEVKALIVYNNELYAGGQFTSPGNNIAKWNGSAWQPVGSGTDGEVETFEVFNGELAVGGNFDIAGGINVNNIARWNGTSWSAYGNGLTGSGDRVNALTVYAGNLVAGGRFDIASIEDINVARWNGSTWSSFNNDVFGDEVQALTVYNSQLYAGGKFEIVGTVPNSKYIIMWNGSAWQSVGGGLYDGDVEALTVYKNNLIAAGNFRVTGTSLYVDRIAMWTGTQWQRMLTGMNNRVYDIYTHNAADTVLYSAGEFTSAGGKWCNFAARWGIFTTSSVSGIVRKEGQLTPVNGGIVKAVRTDLTTREIIVIDSAYIDTNGRYTIGRVPKNDPDVRVIAFPDDEDIFIDTSFVPTYFPSELLWNNAEIINPQNNLDSVNIIVKSRSISDNPPALMSISGSVFLNTVLPPVGVIAVPYWKNSIIYIEQNGNIVTFTQSNELQQYSIGGLAQGTYTMRVTRLGYETETRQVVVTNQNLIENFTLDTMNIIGITNVNSNVPKEFILKQNYPNPFNPVTNIEFSIPKAGFVKLSVFDILGREINLPVNENLPAGTYRVDFNGSELPSGIYFYRIETAGISETRKMILIK